jgi:hypothetical protein
MKTSTVLLTLLTLLFVSCEDALTPLVKSEVRTSGLPIQQLTLLGPSGGTVAPLAGTYPLRDGESLDVHATAQAGFVFTGWQTVVGPGIVGFADRTAASTSVSLTQGDAQIRATFSATPRTLTLTNDGHGTTVPGSLGTVGDGVPYQIDATPAFGYQFDHWVLVSGQALFGNANAASTTVTVSGGNAAIKATFAVGNFTVNLSTAGHGSVSPAGATVLAGGQATNVTAFPDAEYEFVSWSVTPAQALQVTPNLTSASLSIQAGATATLTATFRLKTYQLSPGTLTNGAMTPASTTPITATVPTVVEAYPNQGYRFQGWTSSPSPGALVAFGDVTKARTTVTVTGGNATVTPVFVTWTPSFSLSAGWSAQATDTFDTRFVDALVTGTNLFVLGERDNRILGLNAPFGMVRRFDVSSRTAVTTANDSLTTFNASAPAYNLASNASSLFLAAGTPSYFGSQTDFRTLSGMATGGSLGWVWNEAAGRLLSLSAATPGRAVSVTPQLAVDPAGLTLSDSTVSLSKLLLVPNGPVLALGTRTNGFGTETHMVTFGTSPALQTSGAVTVEDVAEGGKVEAITLDHGGNQSFAVAINGVHANGDSGQTDAYLKFYDVASPVTPQSGGRVFLGTSKFVPFDFQSGITVRSVYWDSTATPNVVLVGGSFGGGAAVWLVNPHSHTVVAGPIAAPPLVSSNTFEGGSVAWIGPGQGGDYLVVIEQVDGIGFRHYEVESVSLH